MKAAATASPMPPAAAGPSVDNEALYNDRWNGWEEMKHTGPMSRHTRRLVLKALRPLRFDSVLDIGCGPGFLLEAIALRHPQAALAGMDISGTAVSLARKRLPRAGFQIGDITLRPPEGAYDLVTMVDVAEHIPDDLGAFRHARTCCAGYFLVCTLEGRMRAFESEVGHVRNYAPGELVKKMEESGFAPAFFHRWGWPFYSPLYRNLNNTVKPHNLRPSRFTHLAGALAHAVLGLSLPLCGDLVIAVGRAV